MRAITIEHVAVAELPQAWRDRLEQTAARVTVHIEAEPATEKQGGVEIAGDSLFGMWRDRKDLADVAGYIRQMRAPRFGADDLRAKP